MADEEQGTVLEVENNSQETPAEEPTQTTDPTTEGTTAPADSGSEGTTESSADVRSKDQIQASERHHQSINSKLQTTVSELQHKLARFDTMKPNKPAGNTSRDTTSENTSEEYVNSEEQLERVVTRVIDNKMDKLSSQSMQNEQMRTIDEAVFRFKADNNISDKVFQDVMKDYGPIVKREIKAVDGDVGRVAEMFLETLTNRAGLERDSQAVEAKKVDASIKGKALQGVQKPATSGAPPTPVKKTESEELLEQLQEVGGSKALSGFFASNSSA